MPLESKQPNFDRSYQQSEDAQNARKERYRREFHADWQIVPENIRDLFRSLVKRIAYSQSKAISREVTSIDLETFSTHAQGIIERTLKDPQALERARAVYATFSGGIIIEAQDTLGEKISTGAEVAQLVFFDYIPGTRVLKKTLVSLMHTHGRKSFPPSPVDCIHLLVHPTDLLSETCCFVITPEKVFLIFRDQDSISHTAQEARAIARNWEKEIDNVLRANSAVPVDSDFLREVVQESLLRKYAQQFGWKIFISTDFETAHLVK